MPSLLLDMPLFDLNHVSKRFGRIVALDEVDLGIAEGGVTALIGPSGAGKSTLLRLLIGLEWPDEGEVRFDGEPLRRDALLEQRRRIGYVIQEGGLFPHITAFANAALLARILGWSAERIRERVSELAELCRLSQDLLERFPAELSGGQRQRVSLIRALMLDPRVLLLDEPLGALDPLIRHDLQEELKQLIATLGKTAILVTHDVAEAAFLADELVLLRKGRIVQQGAPAALLAHPEEPFVQRFLSTQRTFGEPA